MNDWPASFLPDRCKAPTPKVRLVPSLSLASPPRPVAQIPKLPVGSCAVWIGCRFHRETSAENPKLRKSGSSGREQTGDCAADQCIQLARPIVGRVRKGGNDLPLPFSNKISTWSSAHGPVTVAALDRVQTRQHTVYVVLRCLRLALTETRIVLGNPRSCNDTHP